MKKNKFTALLAAAAICASGVIFMAHAAPSRAHGPGHQQPVFQKIISALKLSDEQVEKIKGELKAEKENISPMLQRLHDARKELRETIQSGADETAIREAHSKVADVEGDMAVQRAKVRAKIVPHLTQEQLEKMKKMEAKLDEMAQNRIEHFGKRRNE